MTIKDFVSRGVTVTNNMGEIRRTSDSSIVFDNGWVASIIKNEEGYSVATCDYNGYFDWNVLEPLRKGSGAILCETEDEVCKVLEFIELLNRDNS